MDRAPPAADRARLDEALSLHQQGRLPEAEATLRALLARDPTDFDAQHQLGLVLAGANRWAEAEPALAAAVRLRPQSTDALQNLGLIRQMAGRHETAIECYLAVLAIQPGLSDVLTNLGNAYLALQRFADAVRSYRAATQIDPTSAVAYNNLGLALAQSSQPADAAHAYTEAIRIAPDYFDPLLNLAQLHLAAGRLAAPGALLRRALALQPDFVEARRALAQICELTGEVDTAIEHRRAAIRSHPDSPDLHRELILDLNFADDDDGQIVAEACRDWHRRFADDAGAPLHRVLDRNPDRRLRVGYVGGTQFRMHTLAATMLSLVEAQRVAFDLYCYSDLPPNQEDDITARFRSLMAWRVTSGLTDERFAQSVADDNIDILIDPIGFVGGSRLLALARHPAPVQVSFPLMGPCGGPSIDYVIADEHILPDSARSHYSERVLQVPFAYCYRPIQALPEIGEPPALAAGVITFGSMNTLPKISRGAIHAWRRILDRVTAARLLVKAGFPFRDPRVRQEFLQRLAEEGVDPGRVILKDWTPGHADHLAVYNEIDVALDSFPYCGVITTYEALSMGVPVVTRTGDRVLDRYSSSILSTVGFTDGIAGNDDDYVERAVALASDPDRLRALRRSLRSQLLASTACDAAQVAASLGSALRSAWRDWCET